MPQSYVRVYYHFIWATWNREPLLVGKIERHAYALIRKECEKLKCKLLAIGGIEDHVHLCVSLPQTLCIADFVEDVKGCSSRAINVAHETPSWSFKWQGGYGVLSVSPTDKPRVIQYINRQKEHHAAGTLWPASERCWEDEKPVILGACEGRHSDVQ